MTIHIQIDRFCKLLLIKILLILTHTFIKTLFIHTLTFKPHQPCLPAGNGGRPLGR